MSDPSLFQYLCEKRFVENTLTDGLAYLLTTRRWAKDAAREILARLGGMPPPVEFCCKSQFQFDDGARPDLALLDSASQSVFALLELKIDAVLTPNQPEGYLECITREPARRSAGGEIILFVVPENRRRNVWKEVESKLRIRSSFVSRSEFCLESNHVIISLISWKDFLSGLEGAETVDNEAKEIISIMKAKTENNLHIEIPAISPRVVTDQSIATEILHYMQLVENIIEHLKAASDKDLDVLLAHSKPHDGLGYSFTGRYYSVNEYKWFWIGFSPQDWMQFGVSPIWIAIEKDDTSRDNLTTLKTVFSDLIEAKQAFFDAQPKYAALKIPIRLAAGESGDELVTAALQQISQVVKRVALSKS
jgi:hypothetical protein